MYIEKSSCTCHVNLVFNLPQGWTARLLADQHHSVSLPRSNLLLSWNLNSVVFWETAHTHWGEFVYVWVSSLKTGGLGGTGQLTECTGAWASSQTQVYEMNAVTQTEHLGSHASIYTTGLMTKRAKAKSLLKLKLKGVRKLNEIYHFPVNTKWIHRRLFR